MYLNDIIYELFSSYTTHTRSFLNNQYTLHKLINLHEKSMNVLDLFLIYMLDVEEKVVMVVALWRLIDDVGEPRSTLLLREPRREPLLEPVLDPGAEDAL